MKQRFALLAAIMLLVGSVVGVRVSAQSASAILRVDFVHALPGAPAVDIFVDNLLAAHNMAFGSTSGYLNISEGAHKVIVTATSNSAQPSGTPLLSTSLTLSKSEPTLLVVIQGTLSAPDAAIFDQDLTATASGKARFTAINAIADAPSLDVLYANGKPLIQALKYGQVFGAFDIPAAVSDLLIVPSGSDASAALIKADQTALVAGTQNTLIALGTAGGDVKPSVLLLSGAADPNAPTDVLIRMVNATDGGKPIDVYVNGVLSVPAFASGTFTPHIALPTGAAKIELRNAGDADSVAPIGSADLTLDATKAAAQTIVLTADQSGKYALQAYPDNIATLDPSKARVNLINAISGSASAALGSSTLKAQTGTPTKNIDVANGVYPFKVTVGTANVTDTLTLNGGTLVDLILVQSGGTPKLIVATTNLSTRPGSIPTGASGAAATLAVTATPVAPINNADAPTLVPTPTQPKTPKPTLVPGITGVVNTNPTTNLKIREYPRVTARTLALVPSQSTVIVTGVRGPVTPAGSITGTPTATLAGAPTRTPTLAILSRADIWLFVIWQTTDGGTAQGWADSAYLNITVNGRPISATDTASLLALKQIPENTPGTLENTSITPVAVSNALIGTIKTTNGSNAQLRRTPNIAGESLALLPAGATVIVLAQTSVPISSVVGAATTPIWYFVNYTTADGAVFGWVSGAYVAVTRQNKPVDLTMIPIATEITRGYTQGNPQTGPTNIAPAIGTFATVTHLSDGANLQLRRTPSATAESLGLIPLNTLLTVLGRSADAQWIQVQFGTQTGWVDVQFVTLAKNGKPLAAADLSITSGGVNTFGTATLTVTPTPKGAG